MSKQKPSWHFAVQTCKHMLGGVSCTPAARGWQELRIAGWNYAIASKLRHIRGALFLAGCDVSHAKQEPRGVWLLRFRPARREASPLQLTLLCSPEGDAGTARTEREGW